MWKCRGWLSDPQKVVGFDSLKDQEGARSPFQKPSAALTHASLIFWSLTPVNPPSLESLCEDEMEPYLMLL